MHRWTAGLLGIALMNEEYSDAAVKSPELLYLARFLKVRALHPSFQNPHEFERPKPSSAADAAGGSATASRGAQLPASSSRNRKSRHALASSSQRDSESGGDFGVQDVDAPFRQAGLVQLATTALQQHQRHQTVAVNPHTAMPDVSAAAVALRAEEDAELRSQLKVGSARRYFHVHMPWPVMLHSCHAKSCHAAFLHAEHSCLSRVLQFPSSSAPLTIGQANWVS